MVVYFCAFLFLCNPTLLPYLLLLVHIAVVVVLHWHSLRIFDHCHHHHHHHHYHRFANSIVTLLVSSSSTQLNYSQQCMILSFLCSFAYLRSITAYTAAAVDLQIAVVVALRLHSFWSISHHHLFSLQIHLFNHHLPQLNYSWQLINLWQLLLLLLLAV